MDRNWTAQLDLNVCVCVAACWIFFKIKSQLKKWNFFFFISVVFFQFIRFNFIFPFVGNRFNSVLIATAVAAAVVAAAVVAAAVAAGAVW